jgi:lipopolysaccharide/colanic/teichoic acid biosynthesis glycosyltransferase
MKEFGARVDRYLRREDTCLARFLKTVSPGVGREYRLSPQKRIVELVIVTPIAVITLPVMGILAIAKRLEDGGSAFYVQERISGDKTVPVVKIRCMVEGADKDEQVNIYNAAAYKKECDPRNTRLGRFMRRYELEELPQLWQVIAGQLSLVDFRAAPRYVFEFIEKVRPTTFGEWESAYREGRRPGIFSLTSAASDERKDIRKCNHYDLLYARKASLGLDLYILCRTAARMVRDVAW